MLKGIKRYFNQLIANHLQSHELHVHQSLNGMRADFNKLKADFNSRIEPLNDRYIYIMDTINLIRKNHNETTSGSQDDTQREGNPPAA